MNTLQTKSAPSWLSLPEKGFLNAQQIAVLDAIFTRLLPGDPARHIPSAAKAGASTFVSQLLAMDDAVYVEIPAWRTLYLQALDALTAYSQLKHQLPLTEIDATKMDAIIAGLEQGQLTDLPASLDQKVLFKTLLRHCLQGCFGDPHWGGNQQKIMWRAMGYLQPPEDDLA